MNSRKWIDEYSTDCRLKYNSKATQDNYISCVSMFLSNFDKYYEPKAIPTSEIKEWLLKAQTINTRKHRLCAVKSFYQLTVKMPDKIDRIPYPRSERKLPIVLSQDEIQRMFDVCTNLKHKTILAILYSTGMRVSELINLKWQHVDRSRMIINIIAGKGKKDRQVMLSPELIPLLESYWKQYKPKEYVLNGQKSLQYSPTSVLQVVKQISETAKISKRTYTHLIRHCSFTHLVEAGTDISLIQKIAGHNNVKTTMLYAHISDSLISRIQSPLNSISL